MVGTDEGTETSVAIIQKTGTSEVSSIGTTPPNGNQSNPGLWAQQVASASAAPSDAALPTLVGSKEAEPIVAPSLRSIFETSQSPSKAKREWSWLRKGAAAAALTALFVAARVAGTGFGGHSGGDSSWQYSIEKDAITDRFNYRLEGTSVAVAGSTSPIAMGFNCSRETVQAYIDFHMPLEDAFPKGDVNMVAVSIRLDDADAHTLGFVPTSDWMSVVSLQDGFAGGLTGVLASLSSAILPESQTLDAVWKPKDLARAMADSRKLLVRARTRSGAAVTGVFDLRNYHAEYSRWPCRY